MYFPFAARRLFSLSFSLLGGGRERKVVLVQLGLVPCIVIVVHISRCSRGLSASATQEGTMVGGFCCA